MNKYIKTLVAIAILINLSLSTKAYNLRQVTAKEKLSNNSITSLCQDKEGLLWIGTCDGVNTYDGSSINLYNPPSSSYLLSGMLIDEITEMNDNTLWIQTYYGINRVDTRKGEAEKYTDFNKRLLTTSDALDHFYVVRENNVIHRFNKQTSTFDNIRVTNLNFDQTLQITSSHNKIWAFAKQGQISTYTISEDGKHVEKKQAYKHTTSIINIIHNDESLYMVDIENNLYSFDYEHRSASKIANISSLIEGKGNISSIIKFHDDYFISFTTNGLYKMSLEDSKPTFERIPISSGVFCLLKDRYQDLFWIGTDGKGVYSYSNSEFSIRSTILDGYMLEMTRPVRSIYWDKNRTLWIGSKGDGILQIMDYDLNKNTHDCRIRKITNQNSALQDNAVYSIVPSDKNILWIGTEYGLNYYSYTSNEVYKLKLEYKGEAIKYIHDIYQHGSILWIASVGMGVVKAQIDWRGDTPSLTVIDQIVINDGEMASNYFFSIYPEKDGTIWLANRGLGVFKIDSKTSHIHTVQFEGNVVNEIYSISKDNAGNYLIGTSLGLVQYDGNDTYKMGKVPNNVIHCIENDAYNASWLSTNRGLIYYNSEKGLFRTFNHLDGLDVVEFSDGASYKDEQTGSIFFGGINGFVSVNKNDYTQQQYMPQLSFNKLSIQGKDYNIHDYLSSEDNKWSLTLSHDQNFFLLSFIAIDYLNGNNYSYSYKIEGLNDNWIDLENSNSLSFTNFQPGKYKLRVKYHNRGIDQESEAYSLHIIILPPWYLSPWAYFVYLLLIIGSTAMIIKYFVLLNRKKQNKIIHTIEQQHKEEVYESKLRFFTNIAHEFCTPLTLIYGPCNRILNHNNVDASVLKYTQIIEQNAERLNSLIQELIEFRKIDTGHRNPVIVETQTADIANQICHSFADMADSRNIAFDASIQSDLVWNTDENFYTTILINLVSNALKYSKDYGEVKVKVGELNGSLCLKISNKGRGIKEQDISKLFDRYNILDEFESQEHSTQTSRNGLGLAISSSMIALLSGNIDISSTLNEWTHFTVMLPSLPLDRGITKQTPIDENRVNHEISLKTKNKSITEIAVTVRDPKKKTIMIIDDEPEMLWFISDIFSADYNIVTLNTATDALAKIKEIYPDIILCDVMMPSMDGIEFVGKIKTDKQTSHIPFIFISAKHGMEEQIEGLDAGAELYITKPFNIEYLKTAVSQLISRKKELKEYFSSALSAFDLEDGKLVHSDHKQFVQSIIEIIDKYVHNNKLSAKFIAEELNMSTRTLYRKIKEAGDMSIANMIRDSRLHIAEDLLIKSTMTIDEIVFKSGFNNRVSFYNAFSEKNSCTPSEFREKHNMTAKQ